MIDPTQPESDLRTLRKKIAEEVEPYAIWWDELDDWNEGADHHETCPVAHSLNPTDHPEFYIFEEPDEDDADWRDFRLDKDKLAAACQCWLGAAWRIRRLVTGQ